MTVEPLLPSRTALLAIITTGCWSLSMIVPVPVPSAIVEPVGLESTTVKVSLFS